MKTECGGTSHDLCTLVFANSAETPKKTEFTDQWVSALVPLPFLFLGYRNVTCGKRRCGQFQGQLIDFGGLFCLSAGGNELNFALINHFGWRANLFFPPNLPPGCACWSRTVMGCSAWCSSTSCPAKMTSTTTATCGRGGPAC